MSEKVSRQYTERHTVFNEAGGFENKTIDHTIEFSRKAPKLGVLLVGLGGNNGTTFVSGIIANKHHISFETKKGI